MRLLYSSKGFSLIELLVIISIISLLSTIILASLDDARKGARDSVRKTDIQTLRNAIELYSITYGAYPGSLSDLTNLDDISVEPTDPSGGSYNYSNSGFSFELYAELERGECWYNDTTGNREDLCP